MGRTRSLARTGSQVVVLFVVLGLLWPPVAPAGSVAARLPIEALQAGYSGEAGVAVAVASPPVAPQAEQSFAERGFAEEGAPITVTAGSRLPASAIGQSVRPPYVNLQIALEEDGDEQYLATIRRSIERHGWSAAFYVTPAFAARHPQTVKDLLAERHELGVLIGDPPRGPPDEGSITRIGQALAGVRQAAGLPDDYPLHLRFQSDAIRYDEIRESLRALESLGVPTLTGVFLVGDDFFCRYCAEHGRLMYPLPAEGAGRLVLIPITAEPAGSSLTPAGSATPQKVGSGEQRLVPFDDARFQPENTMLSAQAKTGGPAGLFAAALAKYESFVQPGDGQTEARDSGTATYVHDKFLTLIVHPSVTGADKTALAALDTLLERVGQKSGATVTNAEIVRFTAEVLAAGYITNLAIAAPATTTVQSLVTLTISYQATLFCPTYYFRIYGKYPSQSTWHLIDQASFFVNTGSYAFQRFARVPERPTRDDRTYTFLAVGQACASGRCDWPTPTSYEDKATAEVRVETLVDLEVKSREIVISTPARRGEPVTVMAWVHNNGDEEAQNVRVRIQDYLTAGLLFHEETRVIPVIPGLGKAKVDFATKVWNVNSHRYVFTADPANAIEETDESNNRGETHTITGRITDDQRWPLKHLKVELVRDEPVGSGQAMTPTVRYADLTDAEGKFAINTNLDAIGDGDVVRIRARLEFSPEDDTTKIRFKFYDDARWDAGRPETFFKDTASWAFDRARDYPGKDVSFKWDEGGRTYSTLVQVYAFWKRHPIAKFDPANLNVEFMNDDAQDKSWETSWSNDGEIHMWKSGMFQKPLDTLQRLVISPPCQQSGRPSRVSTDFLPNLKHAGKATRNSGTSPAMNMPTSS